MARLKNRKKTKRLELNYKEFKNKTFKALLLVIILWICYQFIISIVNQPIRYVSIESSFQQVKEAQIRGAISSEVQDGILGIDVSKLYERLKNIAWIDKISISRKWPDRLILEIHEHIPVARWGESSLLKSSGLDYEHLDRNQLEEKLGTRLYKEGLYNPHCYLAQPAALIRSLVGALSEKIELYENTPAISLQRKRSKWLIKTPKSIIKTNKIIWR